MKKTIHVNAVGYTLLLEGPATVTKLTVKGGRAQGMSLYVGAKLHSVFAITKPTLSIEMFNRSGYNQIEVPTGMQASLRLFEPGSLEVTVETQEGK